MTEVSTSDLAFTNEETHKIMDMLRSAPNTGELQGMMMNGGPKTEAEMTALLTKLREVDTAKPAVGPGGVPAKMETIDTLNSSNSQTAFEMQRIRNLLQNSSDFSSPVASFQNQQILVGAADDYYDPELEGMDPEELDAFDANQDAEFAAMYGEDGFDTDFFKPSMTIGLSGNGAEASSMLADLFGSDKSPAIIPGGPMFEEGSSNNNLEIAAPTMPAPRGLVV